MKKKNLDERIVILEKNWNKYVTVSSGSSLILKVPATVISRVLKDKEGWEWSLLIRSAMSYISIEFRGDTIEECVKKAEMDLL